MRRTASFNISNRNKTVWDLCLLFTITTRSFTILNEGIQRGSHNSFEETVFMKLISNIIFKTFEKINVLLNAILIF